VNLAKIERRAPSKANCAPPLRPLLLPSSSRGVGLSEFSRSQSSLSAGLQCAPLDALALFLSSLDSRGTYPRATLVANVVSTVTKTLFSGVRFSVSDNAIRIVISPVMVSIPV
jgi:hypothetical protein